MRKLLVLLFLCDCLFVACDRNDPVPVPSPVLPSGANCDCPLTPVAQDRQLFHDSVRASFDYGLFQVPDSQLARMSTLGVIQTLEHTARIIDMGIYNFIIGGRDGVLKRLNTSHELNRRPDAGTEILKYWKLKSPCCIDTLTTSFQKTTYAVRWAHFELICTQDSLLGKFTSAEKKELAKTVIAKYDERVKMWIGLTDPSGSICTMMLLHFLMQSAAYPPYVAAVAGNADLFKFAGMAWPAPEKSMLDKVLQYARQYIAS